MTKTEEEALLNTPWTAEEAAIIGRQAPGMVRPAGQPNVTRREMRELARRYPSMFPEPPSRPASSREEALLQARYPSMYSK